MKKKRISIKKTIKKRIEEKKKQYIFIEKNKLVNERIKIKMSGQQVKLNSNIECNDKLNLIDDYTTIFQNIVHIVDVKILFLISNYMREDMLLKLLNEINSFNLDYLIFDDKSSYKIDDYRFIINNEHRGKNLYWKTFDEMFKICRDLDYDIFVFSPNDFLKYDFKRIIEYGVALKDHHYIFNIINDGRIISWINQKPVNINNDINKVFFTDCGFFTNKKTLEKFNYTINPVNNQRFNYNNISSGVGEQLTRRAHSMGIPIFMPIKSLAHHGDHESLMHPILRKKDKLKSIH